MRILFILLFYTTTLKCSAQFFIGTDIYKLSSIDSSTIYKHASNSDPSGYIYLMDKSEKRMATINVDEFSLMEGNSLTVLANPGINEVKEIIKVSVVLTSCGSSFDNHYFLLTAYDSLIKLPMIKYGCMDSPCNKTEYVFPIQSRGNKEYIDKVTYYPNLEDYDTYDSMIVQSRYQLVAGKTIKEINVPSSDK